MAACSDSVGWSHFGPRITPTSSHDFQRQVDCVSISGKMKVVVCIWVFEILNMLTQVLSFALGIRMPTSCPFFRLVVSLCFTILCWPFLLQRHRFLPFPSLRCSAPLFSSPFLCWILSLAQLLLIIRCVASTRSVSAVFLQAFELQARACAGNVSGGGVQPVCAAL